MKEKNEVEEPPLKRVRRTISEDEQPKKVENTPKIKPVCPGCLPRFQENQLAHYGPNGCLGDEFTLDDTPK